MTVNFGSIKNMSASFPRMIGDNGLVWNCVKVSMHLDNEGTKDLEKAQKFIPGLKETDTLHIQSMRGSDNPIYNSAISVNGAPLVNGIVNAPVFKEITGLLMQAIKSDDKAIKPTAEFIKSGQLKKDVFEQAVDQVDISEKQLETNFANSYYNKVAAKDIIDDIKINASIELGDILKEAGNAKYLIPPKKTPELPS